MSETAGMTSAQFGRRLAAGAVPILPFGAYEQHGPHLPLTTDTVMAVGLANRIAESIDGIVLPAINYGQTTDSDGYAGTVSLSFDTVRAIASDIAGSVVAQGARALVIVNGDFGNQAPLRIAAREFGQIPIMVVNYPGMAEAAKALLTTKSAGFALRHADEFETSIMLALAPEKVQMELAVAEYPTFPASFPDWQVGLDKFSESGVFGDPRPPPLHLVNNYCPVWAGQRLTWSEPS